MSIVGSRDEDLSPAMYEKLRRLVYDQCGITLGPKKVEMVKSRISKRIRELGVSGFREYYALLVDTQGEMVRFLDAISTNTTHFFREAQHFDFMNEQIQQWYSGGQRKFRLWSAASSSGEEPYTMAITATEAFQADRAVDWRILATDISTKVLQKCQEGVYQKKQFIDMPAPYLKKYFSAQGENYAVSETLKRNISFNRINLSHHPFPMKGPFDLVFCRNVMIYFDEAVRKALVMDIHRLLKPDGFLLVGHAESLTGLGLPFKLVQPAVYQKV